MEVMEVRLVIPGHGQGTIVADAKHGQCHLMGEFARAKEAKLIFTLEDDRELVIESPAQNWRLEAIIRREG